MNGRDAVGVDGDGEASRNASSDPEVVIARLRSHRRCLLVPGCFLIAGTGTAGYLWGTFDVPWGNAAIATGFGVVVFLASVIPFFSWLSYRCVVTNKRLIVRRGFLVNVRQEVFHAVGYQVTVRRTWLQALFRSGDIHVNSGLGRTVILRDMPSAMLVFATLNEFVHVPAPVPVPAPSSSGG